MKSEHARSDAIIDIRNVEKYILINYEEPRIFVFRPIRRTFLYAGLRKCVGALLLLTFAFSLHIFSDDGSIPLPLSARENVNVLILIIVFLLIGIVVALSIKEQKYLIRKFSHMHLEEIEKQRAKSKSFAVGGSGLIFFAITLFRALNPEAFGLIPAIAGVIVCCIMLALLLVNFACGNFYAVYLHKKYCPYLNAFEDRRYNEDINIDN
ncbi:MAG: hypothetical protein FWE32_07415 [Oscillospiraceae bacterium]|nr:hypothetical protein [Oscillospiraceae bacterium]